MASLRSKIPEEAAPEFMVEVRAIRDASNLEAACAQVHRVRTRFARELPSAIACLEDDLEALLVDPPPAGSSPPRLSDDEPHRAELRGRTAAIEGDPALFRRAQTRSARVHYLTVIASEQVVCYLCVSGIDRSIPGLTLPCHSLWHGSGTPAWRATR